jgi:hypothetical protein
MAYKPTGNPAGRPPKHAAPETSLEPLVLRPCGCGAYTTAPVLEAVQQAGTRSEMPFDTAPCCPVCHPDGWPAGYTGYGCQHGIWARRI